MDITALQTEIRLIKPILDANMAAAHREYMAGDIPAGAFRYVTDRHNTALLIDERRDADMDAESAYRAAAPLTIDLKYGCEDAKDTAPLNRWLSFFDDAGFTDRHPWFEIPLLPPQPERQ